MDFNMLLLMFPKYPLSLNNLLIFKEEFIGNNNQLRGPTLILLQFNIKKKLRKY